MYKLNDVLPHAGRMMLLDEIIEWGDGCIETRVTIKKSTLFQDADGNVPAYIGLEYMAQTIAALAGIEDRIAGRPIKIGLLLGTRRLELNAHRFYQGQSLIIRAESVWRDSELAAFDCTIVDSVTTASLVSGRVNAYQPEEAKDYRRRRL